MRSELGVFLIAVAAVSFSACSDEDEPASLADAGAGEADAASGGGDAGGADANTADATHDSGIIDLCNPLDQSGCTPPDDKCVIEGVAGEGAHCVPSGNDVAIGQECTGEDCLARLACVMTSSVSTCVQICDIGAGTGCEALGNNFDCSSRITGTNYGACLLLRPVCNPLDPVECMLDEACQIYTRRNGQRELRCRTPGPQAEDQPCGSSANNLTCGRGLQCVRDGATGEARCVKFCDTNDDCTAPKMCTGVLDDPPFQFCDT